MDKRADPPTSIKERMGGLMKFVNRRREAAIATEQAPLVLKVARYTLILMDRDGQVVWTGEWGTGGSFDFGPRHSLLIFCEYTNHSDQDAEVSEYEIELMDEEGLVIERFGSAFGDSIIVIPGESRVFSAQWHL